ncbi:MAG TPA: COQ9 family protein [Stellaceae bacterium]|nr:COQ9 family protein [Stellaceae bacterium]
MRSPLAEAQREALIAAMLPDVAFDGWSRAALRTAARRHGMPASEALALFPGGAADLVAAFSHRTDRQMLDRFEAAAIDGLRVAERIAVAIGIRFEVLSPWREAVRRSLSILAMPQHTPLALRLTYRTVDAMWYAAGDTATDFSFYSKRLSLAAVYATAVLYWLDDRSEDFAETRAFVERRLAGAAGIRRIRRDLEAIIERMPNPLRLLRPQR